MQLKRNLSYIYLSLVPLLTAVFGFGVGHISYKIYLPIWIVNVLLMLASAWLLGLKVICQHDTEKSKQAYAGLLLIIPWILVSIFFGFGPPPEKATEWVATATEQQIRYSILIAAGVFIVLGFAVLRQVLKSGKGDFYSNIGFTAMLIAIPLFIINMIFWGFFLTESFRILVTAGSDKMPEWFSPIRKQFGMISVVEVALTYLATAAFGLALKLAGWFNKTACWAYILISLFAFFIIILSACCSEPFITAGFAVSIPAIPFIMPYLIGINLLRHAAK